MRDYLVAGNWKMNGSNAANSTLLSAIIAGAADHAGIEYLVCPPYIYLGNVAEQVAGTNVQLGAQSVSEHAAGAFTGEISANMLKEFPISYVIVGHSERRALFGESDEVVADKFVAAAEAGFTPILCVGETLEERDAEQTNDVVSRQLAAVLGRVGKAGFANAVVAYEPVWAIGTGRTASPEQAQAVHAHLRAEIASVDAELGASTRILYGGSVNGKNAAGLFAMADIDGGLIGGAALKPEEFLAIGAAAVAA